MKKRWEYYVLESDEFREGADDVQDYLDRLGSEGWELVEISNGYWIFKSELED